jgi:hypothetical protein
MKAFLQDFHKKKELFDESPDNLLLKNDGEIETEE